MLYLDLFCGTLSKICPKMSEKPKRVRRDVTLSIKLDVTSISIVANDITFSCVSWYDLVG